MDPDTVALLAWDFEDLADLAGDLGGKWQLATVSAAQTVKLQVSARLYKPLLICGRKKSILITLITNV